MKLLLHCCCAPCSAYPISFFISQNIELDLIFYNPNIHPYREWQNRMFAMKNYAEKIGLNLLINYDYPLERIIKGMLDYHFERENRCEFCYLERLRFIAKFAKENEYEAFSTTLLISPYQDHLLIKSISEKVGRNNEIKFYYKDFRNNFKESKDIAKNNNLYSQTYCGCVFSERDRYLENPKFESRRLR